MVDLVCTLIFFGAMLAGYLAGGFREILRVTVMIGLMVLFMLPSVKGVFLQFGPAANGIFIVAFLVVYFTLNFLVAWVLKGIIETKDGVLGSMNKGIGVIAGFLKAMLLVIFAAYITRFLWSKQMLSEAKPALDDSFIFSLANAILDFLM
jgi:hypothetical protein